MIPLQNNSKPVYILVNNIKTLAYTDGKGNAFKAQGEGYEVFNNIESKCTFLNKYNKDEYKFDRFLSSMDF